MQKCLATHCCTASLSGYVTTLLQSKAAMDMSPTADKSTLESSMNRLAYCLLLLPAVAFAGTSDPAGIATAILWMILGAFGLWVFIAICIGRAFAQSMPLRTLIAIALCGAPLAYCGINSNQYQNGIEELAAENQALVLVANAYLAKRCALDRVTRADLPVETSDGVFIDFGSEQRLDLPGTPPPLLETPRMRDNQKRYGESNPLGIHDVQYKKPIYWVQQMYADSVLSASSFDFVEANDLYTSGRPLRATARKKWWLSPGQEAIVPQSKQELERRLANMPDQNNFWLTQPITTSTARYVLSVTDISTLEDRKHWVARGRLRLVHKGSGQAVAEYIGFVANLGPAYSLRNSYAWERVDVCPGKERAYQVDRRPWDVVGFFFREVVSYKPASAQ